MPRTNSTRTLLCAALAATAASGSIALAEDASAPAADPDATTVTLTKAAPLKAGDRAPFDVPGVRAIRRGKTIPSGYVLPGYAVTVHNGAVAAGASFKASCPAGKTLRSFAITGKVGFGVDDGRYVGRRSYPVSSYRGRAGGNQLSGTLYAVCR